MVDKEEDPLREQKMLQFVEHTATAGDPDSVLSAIDKFCWSNNWMMNVGDEKGAILDKEIQNAKPKVVVEIGTYCGYSATRICRNLPPDARMFTLEFNPKNASVARRILQLAGFSDRVTIIEGDAAESLRKLRKEYNVDTVDFFFIDHWKEYYLPHLKVIEEEKLMHPGTVLVADNIIYPGAPDYLKYVQESPLYKTVVYEAHLEYSTQQKDAVAVSVFLGYDAK